MIMIITKMESSEEVLDDTDDIHHADDTHDIHHTEIPTVDKKDAQNKHNSDRVTKKVYYSIL